MRTKTVAVEAAVYEKLVSLKSGDEPLSKVIERLTGQSATAHTGAAILSAIKNAPDPLSAVEAAKMTQVVEANRNRKSGSAHDLP